MQEDWAAALLDPDCPLPQGLASWNGSDPQQRFNVYRNNVVVSLVESLAQTFPVSRELVGEDFFYAMGREYVRAQPPRSALLTQYGESFAEFVRGFPPAAAVPYLADMARLEMLRLNALHAADARAIDAQLLNSLLSDPQRLAGLKAQLHPSLHSVQSEFAIFSLWAAHQGELDLDEHLAQVNPFVAESGWVLRSGLEVKALRMCAGDCAFIAALASGAALGEAAETAARDSEFDLGRCLSVLLRHDLIVSLSEEKCRLLQRQDRRMKTNEKIHRLV